MLKRILKSSFILALLVISAAAIAQTAQNPVGKKSPKSGAFSGDNKADFEKFKSQKRQDFEEFKSKNRADFEKFKSSIYQAVDGRNEEMRQVNQQMATPARAPETTLLKVPLYFEKTDEHFFFSPDALAVFNKTESLDSLVKVQVSDGEVYVLPEEEQDFPAWYEAEKAKLSHTYSPQADLEPLCPPGTPSCEDLLFFVSRLKANPIYRVKVDPAYFSQGQEAAFAQKLREQKRGCLQLCSAAVDSVEERQRTRLLGDNYNVAALEDFMWQGEFTAKGWVSVFRAFYRDAKAGKLNNEQLKQIKKFAKKTKRLMDKKEIPVICQAGEDTWWSVQGAFLKTLSQIEAL